MGCNKLLELFTNFKLKVSFYSSLNTLQATNTSYLINIYLSVFKSNLTEV